MTIDQYCGDLFDYQGSVELSQPLSPNEVLIFETEAGRVVLSYTNVAGGVCNCCINWTLMDQEFSSVERVKL